MKGYEPGQTTSFTPSRQAEWIHEFNQILEQGIIKSRNKVTEIILEKGIEAWKNSSDIADQPVKKSSPVLDGSVTLKCDKLSSEQKELLQTSHFQNLLEEFTIRLFNDMGTSEQKLMDEFTQPEVVVQHNELIDETAASVSLSPNTIIPEITEYVEQKDEHVNQVLPDKEKQPRKKADILTALNYVKNTQLKEND